MTQRQQFEAWYSNRPPNRKEVSFEVWQACDESHRELRAERDELRECVNGAAELFELLSKFTGGELTRIKLWVARASKVLGEKQ